MSNNIINLSKFNINNLIINRVVRGVMVDRFNNIMWTINQIENPSLQISSESRNVIDALGNIITSFNNSKSAEFSAEQSIFDLSLFASQLGSKKIIATNKNMITVPIFETISVPKKIDSKLVDINDNILISKDGFLLIDGSEVITMKLKKIPISTPKKIYKLNNDGSLGNCLTYSSVLKEGSFTYYNGTIRLLEKDVSYKDKLFITYDYLTSSAVSIVNSSIGVIKEGKFILEILCCDICNPNELVYAYLIFPNARLDANVDISFTAEGKHPFVVSAKQGICDNKKILFQLIVPD